MEPVQILYSLVVPLAAVALGALLTHFLSKSIRQQEQRRAEMDNQRAAVAAYIRESRELINDYNRRTTEIIKDGPPGDFSLPAELQNQAGGLLSESQLSDLGTEKILYYHTTIVSLEVLELHLHYPNLRAAYWKLRNAVVEEYEAYTDLLSSADNYAGCPGRVDLAILTKLVESPITEKVGNKRKEFKELAVKELSLGPPPGYQIPGMFTPHAPNYQSGKRRAN